MVTGLMARSFASPALRFVASLLALRAQLRLARTSRPRIATTGSVTPRRR
jgi:hypothetical protein